MRVFFKVFLRGEVCGVDADSWSEALGGQTCGRSAEVGGRILSMSTTSLLTAAPPARTTGLEGAHSVQGHPTWNAARDELVDMARSLGLEVDLLMDGLGVWHGEVEPVLVAEVSGEGSRVQELAVHVARVWEQDAVRVVKPGGAHWELRGSVSSEEEAVRLLDELETGGTWISGEVVVNGGDPDEVVRLRRVWPGSQRADVQVERWGPSGPLEV
jgi:hypothetical protein